MNRTIIAGLALGLMSTACDGLEYGPIKRCPTAGGKFGPCPVITPPPPPPPPNDGPEERPDCKNPDWPC